MKIITYNLGLVREKSIIFNNISFTLEQGDIMLIQGNNGSGKTSLLKIIAGIIVPTKGYTKVDAKGEIKKYIAYIDSTPRMQEHMTVLEYFFYWGIYYCGIENYSTEYVDHVISMLELETLKTRIINQLSLGQKKRVLIGKLMITQRPIWLLDEPTIGLDSYWTTQFYALMHKHRLLGGITILTTHTKYLIQNLQILQL